MQLYVMVNHASDMKYALLAIHRELHSAKEMILAKYFDNYTVIVRVEVSLLIACLCLSLPL